MAEDERKRGKPHPAPSVRTNSGYREEQPKSPRDAVVGSEKVARDAEVPSRPPASRKPKDAPV